MSRACPNNASFWFYFASPMPDRISHSVYPAMVATAVSILIFHLQFRRVGGFRSTLERGVLQIIIVFQCRASPLRVRAGFCTGGVTGDPFLRHLQTKTLRCRTCARKGANFPLFYLAFCSFCNVARVSVVFFSALEASCVLVAGYKCTTFRSPKDPPKKHIRYVRIKSTVALLDLVLARPYVWALAFYLQFRGVGRF